MTSEVSEDDSDGVDDSRAVDLRWVCALEVPSQNDGVIGDLSISVNSES